MLLFASLVKVRGRPHPLFQAVWRTFAMDVLARPDCDGGAPGAGTRDA
jgi:hypothetical protein